MRYFLRPIALPPPLVFVVGDETGAGQIWVSGITLPSGQTCVVGVVVEDVGVLDVIPSEVSDTN